ncbi:MAG: hypothetical protein EXR69_00845 [Myxococcales bacterium]|nr:hypothetical protein [Myxococcales bacterium]
MLPICTTCGQHVRPTERSCPFCAASIARPAAGPMRLPTAASIALGLGLSGCIGTSSLVAAYGAAPTDRADTAEETGGVDADADGYYAVSSGGTDCNDEDATVHPEATETAGDGLDSNCDGEDDT